MVYTLPTRPEQPEDANGRRINALKPGATFQATEGVQTPEEMIIDAQGRSFVIRVYPQGGTARIAFSDQSGESPAPVELTSTPMAADVAEIFAFDKKVSLWFITDNSGTTVTMNVTIMV